MKLALVFIFCISLLAGITFFAVTGDMMLFFLPFVINYIGVSLVAIPTKLFIDTDDEEKEDFSAYKNAHSL